MMAHDQSFLDVQSAAGAVFADERHNVPFALHFGDPLAEYRLAQSGAAL